MQELKIVNICYLSERLRVRNPECVQWGGSASRSLRRLQSAVVQGCCHLEARLGIEGLLPSSLPGFLAGGHGSSAECPRVLMALQLVSPGASLPRFLSALKMIFSAPHFSPGFQMSKLGLSGTLATQKPAN